MIRKTRRRRIKKVKVESCRTLRCKFAASRLTRLQVRSSASSVRWTARLTRRGSTALCASSLARLVMMPPRQVRPYVHFSHRDGLVRRLGPQTRRAASSRRPQLRPPAAVVVVNYGLMDKKVPASSLSPLPLPTVTNSSLVAPLDEFPPPKAIPQRLLRTTCLPF